MLLMSQDDTRHSFDAERFAEGFEEVERVTHFVDPESLLGKAMAEARESWARNGGPPDPDDFKIVPDPVNLDDDQ